MMQCDLCGDSSWIAPEYEEEVGFVDTPCPKCQWPRRALPPIPAPLDGMGMKFGISDSDRIQLGIEYEWAKHGPAW